MSYPPFKFSIHTFSILSYDRYLSKILGIG